MSATGTDGMCKIGAQIDAHLRFCSGHREPSAITENEIDNSEKNFENTSDNRPQPEKVTSRLGNGETWGTRIRT